MKLRNLIIVFILTLSEPLISAQSFKEQYEQFKNNAKNSYSSFRDECNQRYIKFLAEAWDWYEGKAPRPMPKDESPVPPKPYIGENDKPHIDTKPIEIDPVDNNPQPKPIEPIKEIPTPDEDYFTLKFYG